MAAGGKDLLKLVAAKLPGLAPHKRGIVLNWHQLAPGLLTHGDRCLFLHHHAPRLQYKLVALWVRHPPGKLVSVEEHDAIVGEPDEKGYITVMKGEDFYNDELYDDSLAVYEDVFPNYGDKTTVATHAGIVFTKS